MNRFSSRFSANKPLFGYENDANAKLDLHAYKRLLNEVRDVNKDFNTLRTILTPDPEDKMNLFYFTLIPADGAMAQQPLVGRMIIPRNYPVDPPVIHLFTTTKRYNVDVYRSYIDRPASMHSSMCFNVLRSQAQGGIWKPEFTVSCLFASLIQAIVTMQVEQEYGPDQAEYVTMETLKSVHDSVHNTYQQWKDKCPPPPPLLAIDVKPVPCFNMRFSPSRSYKSKNYVNSCSVSKRGETVSFVSDAFSLQTGDDSCNVSFAVDLAQLHHGCVFSVILTDDPQDLVGKKRDTTLIRNGVTATAAKKKYGNNAAKWFYHGKPLVGDKNGLKLWVTVAKDQFVFSYKEGNRQIVHGDCPVSLLTQAEIGNCADLDFYLVVFLRLKSGAPVNIPFIPVEDVGYIHPRDEVLKKFALDDAFLELTLEDEEEENFLENDKIEDIEKAEQKNEPKIDIKKTEIEKPPINDLPLFVRVLLDSEEAGDFVNMLNSNIEENFKDIDLTLYNTIKGEKAPPHITLIFNRDLPRDEYKQFLIKEYQEFQNEEIEFSITGYAIDQKCVCLLVDSKSLNPEVNFYPNDKNLHLTMFLKRNIQPVYSNTLIQSCLDNPESKTQFIKYFDEPIKTKGTLELFGKLK